MTDFAAADGLPHPSCAVAKRIPAMRMPAMHCPDRGAPDAPSAVTVAQQKCCSPGHSGMLAAPLIWVCERREAAKR